MKIGTTELLIVLVVVIIIFGPTQIPKLTRMFGKSVREFRDAVENKEDNAGDPQSKTEVSAAESKDKEDE